MIAKFDFLRPHLRKQVGRTELRTWVMELKDETGLQKEEAL